MLGSVLSLVAALRCSATIEPSLDSSETSYVSNQVIYDIEWRTAKELPVAVSDATASVVSSEAYIIGGCDSQYGNTLQPNGYYSCTDLSSKIMIYNPQANAWRQGAENMMVERFRHSAVVIGTDILVVGGADKDDAVMRSVLKYSTSKDEWTMIAEFSGATKDNSAFVHDGKMIVCGGYNIDYSKTNHECFSMDPAGSPVSFEVWTPLKTGRGDFRILLHDGIAYAFGGFDKDFKPLDTLEKIDPAAAAQFSTWTEQAATMKHGRGDFAGVVLHDRLLAMGGEMGSTDDILVAGASLRHVEAYEVATGSWLGEDKLMPIPYETFRFCGAVIGEAAFIFGGQGKHEAGCDCYPTKKAVFVYAEKVTPEQKQQSQQKAETSTNPVIESNASVDKALGATGSTALLMLAASLLLQ